MKMSLAVSALGSALILTLIGSFFLTERANAAHRRTTTAPCYDGTNTLPVKPILDPQQVGHCAPGPGFGNGGIPLSCKGTWYPDMAAGYWHCFNCGSIRLPNSRYEIGGIPGAAPGSPPPDGTYWWIVNP